MKASLKIALLLGAVCIAGANAQVAPADDSQRSERSADRLVREFDVNHDGRVTRAEMNGVLGWRFASATHGRPAMMFEEFLAARADAFRARNADTFRSLDWNGDGRLTLAEYAAGERARFLALDREGQGFVSCAVSGRAGWRGGISSFCADNDTNMDGRVTRAELDAAVTKRFAQASGGGGTMSLAQYQLGEQQRFAIANARSFRRLDADGDGTLSLQEYAAVELKTFARLDKNNDGVLTADELHPRVARADRGRGRRYD